MSPEELSERLGWYSCPQRYAGCRFENFDAYTSELEDRLALAKRAAAERRSIFLFGPVGSGKTHLAVATMADWVGRGARGTFISAIDFAYRVQSAFGNATTVVNELLDEDDRFALVDDIGAEKTGETARAALLDLVDRIYRDKLRLIATSNLMPAELGRYEPRLMSRVTEVALLVEVRAEDFRLKIARERKDGQPRRESATVN